MTELSELYGDGDGDLDEQDQDGLWRGLVGGIRHKMSEATGRQRVVGLLLLHDLRHLHLRAMQVAQAVRDERLLEASLTLHERRPPRPSGSRPRSRCCPRRY